jgi:hypothetical protein
VLSGVGSFLPLFFRDGTGFALSGVVFCDWFCCASVNGIVSMAKRKTIRILIFVSGRKELDQHYKACSLWHLEKPRPRSAISLALDNHITISGSSCAQRPCKGASEYEKSTPLLFTVALSVSMSSVAFAQGDKSASKPMDKMDQPMDKKEDAKAKRRHKYHKKEKKEEMKKDEMKNDQPK